MVVHVESNNFENEVIKSNMPVLVDFFATWCGPCKMIAPTIEQLASEYDGKAKIAKLDIDAAGDVAQRYNVMSVPTLLFFKGGKTVEQIVGAVPKDMIKGKLEELI